MSTTSRRHLSASNVTDTGRVVIKDSGYYLQPSEGVEILPYQLHSGICDVAIPAE